MIHTQLFWDTVKRGEYEIVISNVTLDELSACPEPKRSFMFIKLAEIPYLTRVEEGKEARRLAQAYVDAGGLPSASGADALHIAIAAIDHCDYVASWNLKHMANLRANKAVTEVNAALGFENLEIKPPHYFIVDEEETP
jgi:hypothetical protein